MRLVDYDKLQLKLRKYADKKAANGEIELANGILKAKCFIDQECEIINEKQLNGGWIPISERLPKSKEWCWVWFDYGSKDGDGYCDKMFLNSSGKWMKNTLSTVKDEFMQYIIAWQPYYEPEPFKEETNASNNKEN